MARKNTLVHKLVSDQSLASDFISPATVVKNLDNCSYQINVSTTDSTGTFSVEVSNDYQVNEVGNSTVINPGHWAVITLAGGSPTVAAEDDTIVINLNQLPFYAIRLVYSSNNPGTGTCSIYIANKQIGG